MKNRVITISREFGSGGRTIGKKVAEQLGIPCYDAEISTETVMHVFIASSGVFVAYMFPIHQFLYLFSTSHGLFSIPLRHTQNPFLPKTSSGKCSNRTGCSLPF